MIRVTGLGKGYCFSVRLGHSLARSRVRPWRYSLQNSTPYQSPIDFSVLFKPQIPFLLEGKSQQWLVINSVAIFGKTKSKSNCLSVACASDIDKNTSKLGVGGCFAVTSTQGWSAGRARDGPPERQNNPPAPSLRTTPTAQSTKIGRPARDRYSSQNGDEGMMLLISPGIP